MIVLYSLLMFVLVAAKFLVGRRVARLEKRFIHTADQADHLLTESLLKGSEKPEPLVIAGVTVQKKTALKEVKTDPAQAAKRQYQLGLLVQKRDRLEEKHLAWERRYEKLNAVIERIRAWKGRKVPYTFGVLDVSAVMYAIDRYGLSDYLNVERVTELVNTYITG